MAFATAWAEVAPGWGGWDLAFCEAESGQIYCSVIPPAGDNASFCLTPHMAGVCTTFSSTGVQTVGDHDTLEEALLGLCALAPDQLAEANRRAAEIICMGDLPAILRHEAATE